jgi:hypothetical protein
VVPRYKKPVPNIVVAFPRWKSQRVDRAAGKPEPIALGSGVIDLAALDQDDPGAPVAGAFAKFDVIRGYV